MGVVRGCGLLAEFLCAAGVKAGLCPVGKPEKRHPDHPGELPSPPSPFQIPNIFSRILLEKMTGIWEEGGISLPVNANNWPVCL